MNGIRINQRRAQDLEPTVLDSNSASTIYQLTGWGKSLQKSRQPYHMGCFKSSLYAVVSESNYEELAYASTKEGSLDWSLPGAVTNPVMPDILVFPKKLENQIVV